MSDWVLLVSGWTAAVLSALVAASIRRAGSIRMEALVRACHELRGAITAVRLGIELAGRVGELSPARLRAIELELARASLALDDLARVCAGRPSQLAREPIDVPQLLSDIVEGQRRPGVELRLRWSGPVAHVYGDRVRLAQAVGNLIANAIEHGAAPVEVGGRVSRGSVRIEVVDSGPGLPASVAALVARIAPGRGARGRGLAIASTIASQHGGRLAAAPARSGARLVLELPDVVGGEEAVTRGPTGA